MLNQYNIVIRRAPFAFVTGFGSSNSGLILIY